MKKLVKQITVTCFSLFCCLGMSSQLFAAGLLTPVNSNLAELEIQQQFVDVQAYDNLAVISVEQTFYNPSQQVLEAIYQFPVPKDAAVGQFSWWLNGQEIQAEVIEKTQAKQIYEQQKSQGKDAAVVEKNEFFDFKIKLSQVQPQSEARIKLVYLQKLAADHGVFSFNYPLEEGGTDDAAINFWTNNDKVKQSFKFNLTLHSSYPIDALRLPQHAEAKISQLNEHSWQVSLINGGEGQTQAFRLDKDIVAYWRLTQDAPAGLNLISYKPDENSAGTFMLTVTPGDDLQPITQGTDWTFVLDKSGSMAGKWQSLLSGVEQAIKKMSVNDRVRIVLFDQSATDISKGFVNLTDANKQHLTSEIQKYSPSGGTNLYQALNSGLAQFDADRTAGIIFVTDGVATVGEKLEREFIKLLNNNDIRLFTFIMGNGANTPLLEDLAKQSNGFAMSISNSDDIVGKVMLAASKISHQALHDIKLDFDGGNIKLVTPANIGSLYRGQQLTVFGQYKKAETIQFKMTAKRGAQPVSYQAKFELAKQKTEFPELERLAAFSQISDLGEIERRFGKTEDSEASIRHLGLTFGLVTDYTSMILLEENEYESLGIERKNQQRVNHEEQARAQRATQVDSQHHIAGSEQSFGGTRATPSNGGSGGSFSYVWLILFAVIYLVRSKFKAFE